VYASYFYGANANAQDVMNDIVAILTGETDVNNLSASCNKTQTQIKTDYSPSGWSLEGSPSTSQAVLSSPHTQDNARKKLLVLDSSTFSSGYLKVGSAKAYDPNSGLTSTYFLPSSWSPKIDLTNGGRLDIYADPQIVLFLSYTGGTFSYLGGVCELDVAPYNNKGWGVIARGWYVYVAEVTKFNGSISSWFAIPFKSFIARDPRSFGQTVEAIKDLVSFRDIKILSSIPSVYRLPKGFGAAFDTIAFPDGKTYVIWPDVLYGTRLAVPWG